MEADEREIATLSGVIKEEKYKVDMMMAENHEIVEKHRLIS